MGFAGTASAELNERSFKAAFNKGVDEGVLIQGDGVYSRSFRLKQSMKNKLKKKEKETTTSTKVAGSKKTTKKKAATKKKAKTN